MKRILVLIILSAIFATSCVNVTGKDKEVLDASVVWADSIYKIAEKEKGDISGLVLLEWLDQNRKCWALFAGANEGKTSTEVLEELEDKDENQTNKTN